MVLAMMLAPAPLAIMVGAGPGPMAQTARSPIKIEGDPQFTLANGVVAGDGSISNPYIIENWSINASSDQGIFIRNTTKHVVIRNCYIYDGLLNNHDGIFLSNLTNASVTDSQLKNHYRGIYIYYSSTVSVTDTTITDVAKHGIYLENSNKNRIDNVTSKGSTGGHAIYLERSNLSLVSNCTLSGNHYAGIEDDYTNNNTYRNNTMYDNGWNGFDMIQSVDARVIDNTIVNCTEGVYTIRCKRCLFEGNRFFNNSDVGLTLRDMSTTRVIDNEVHGSSEAISLESVGGSLLSGNWVHDNGEGIGLWDSSNNTFYSNVMERNGYNFGMWRWTGLDTVTTNNTIDGKPVYYWYNQSGKTVPANAGYVALIYCKDILVKGHDLSHNYQGVIAVHSSNITVQDNIFSDDLHGIDVDTSQVKMIGNRIINTTRAIDIMNSDNNLIKGNLIHNTSHGIDFWGGLGTVIEDNVIDNITSLSGYDYSGIHLYEAGPTEVRNNTIRDGVGNGIYSYDVDHLWVEENDIRNFSKSGMWIRGTPSDIRNNTILDCQGGLRLEGSRINVFDNTVIGNDLYGVLADTPVSSRISNNDIQGSSVGLDITNSAAWSVINGNRIIGNLNGIAFAGYIVGCLFYNNYLSNLYNIAGDHSDNTWNISKAPGRNIAEGPFMGGNYWSDYNGTDLDEDFIGDTNLPWGPGDLRPLIYYPAVRDMTKGTPFTNASFTFDAAAYYKAGVKNVTVEYWYDEPSLGHQNCTLSLATGNTTDGKYSGTIKVPVNVHVLSYLITARSTTGTAASTVVRHLDVVDTIGPTVKDLSGTPLTGRNFTFNISAADNWAITDIRVSYWFDNGNATNVSGANVTAGVPVPEAAHEMHYTINVSDAAGHGAGISIEKDVVDVIRPTVRDPAGDPRTGQAMNFTCNATDNWEVGSVRLTYWFHGAIRSLNMTYNGSGYYVELGVPTNAVMMNYNITATDVSGNVANLNGAIPVKDVIGPAVVDRLGIPKTGENYLLSANMTDIIDGTIKDGILDYWFDISTPVRVNFDGVFNILVPGYAHFMNYTIWCVDRSRNPGHLNRSLAIIDNESPTIADASQSTAEVGKAYNFSVVAMDNWNIRIVYVEYWFEGQRTQLNLTRSGNDFIGTITVPAGARKLHYIVHAEDGSGNKATMQARDLNVRNPVQPPHKLTNQNGWVLPALLLGLIVAVLVLITLALWKSGGQELEPHRTNAIEIDMSEE